LLGCGSQTLCGDECAWIPPSRRDDMLVPWESDLWPTRYINISST